jgi:RNA polymerase sigma-70 factor (ECF subfamily)
MTALARLEGHVPALRRYARTLLHDAVEADDLVQDCLVRAVERIQTLRTIEELRPWLFAIMYNLHVSRWRRRQVRASSICGDSEAGVAVTASQPATTEMRAVLRSLAELPQEQRNVLILVAVEGFKYAEVAKLLDIPVGTVMSRLSRARDRLREKVERGEPRACVDGLKRRLTGG